MDKIKSVPLSVMLEQAKAKVTAAFGQIQEETHLPAYLFEGIVAGVLADVRNQKNLELAADFASMGQEMDENNHVESEGSENG